MTQDPAYYQFAEQGARLGIPYFANVVSNLPFLLVAMAGVGVLRRDRAMEGWERRAFTAFVVGTALVAFGSAYFHWAPSDARLRRGR